MASSTPAQKSNLVNFVMLSFLRFNQSAGARFGAPSVGQLSGRIAFPSLAFASPPIDSPPTASGGHGDSLSSAVGAGCALFEPPGTPGGRKTHATIRPRQQSLIGGDCDHALGQVQATSSVTRLMASNGVMRKGQKDRVRLDRPARFIFVS